MKKDQSRKSFQNLINTLQELDAKGNVRKFIEAARDAISSIRPHERNHYCEIRIRLAEFLLARKGTIPSDHIEEGIARLKEVAKVEVGEAHREKWRIIQLSLGLAYHRQRVCGDKEHNLRQALCFYRRALRDFDRKKWPRKWAALNVDMADAYFFLTTGDIEANLRKAFAHLKDAIQVYTKEVDSKNFKDAVTKAKLVEQRIEIQQRRRKLTVKGSINSIDESRVD